MRHLIAAVLAAASLAIPTAATAGTRAPIDDGGDPATYIATWTQWGPDGEMFCWALFRGGDYIDGRCWYT